MGKSFLFGRRVLWLLCLAAAACWPGYRAVRNHIAERTIGQLRSESQDILQGLRAAALQKSVLLKKAAREAGEHWEAGDALSCRVLPAGYIASYDAATGMGLNLAAGASPDGQAVGVYAFRDEDRPVTFGEFPSGIDAAASFDAKGPTPVLWLPFRRHPLTGAPTVTAVCPVRTADGERAGTAVADMDIFELQRLVSARGLPPSLTVDVLDGAGAVLASSRPAALMRNAAQSAPPGLVQVIGTLLSEDAGDLVYEDGTETMRLVFGTLPATGWKVCMRSRVREDLQNLRWFWENDVRIFSCCGFHTLRRTAVPSEREEPDRDATGTRDRSSAPGKRRRFAPEFSQ